MSSELDNAKIELENITVDSPDEVYPFFTFSVKSVWGSDHNFSVDEAKQLIEFLERKINEFDAQ